MCDLVCQWNFQLFAIYHFFDFLVIYGLVWALFRIWRFSFTVLGGFSEIYAQISRVLGKAIGSFPKHVSNNTQEYDFLFKLSRKFAFFWEIAETSTIFHVFLIQWPKFMLK